MKKLILFVILMLAMLFTCACADNNNNSQSSGDNNSASEKQINLADKLDIYRMSKISVYKGDEEVFSRNSDSLDNLKEIFSEHDYNASATAPESKDNGKVGGNFGEIRVYSGKKLYLTITDVSVKEKPCICIEKGDSKIYCDISEDELNTLKELYRTTYVQLDSGFSEEETYPPRANIPSMEELEYDKITKISSYVGDDEVFLEDEGVISDLCNAVKAAKVNEETIESMEPDDGVYYSGCNHGIFAYSGDELLYTFTAMYMKKPHLYVEFKDSSYVYCDISDKEYEAIDDIYKRIYDKSEYAKDDADTAE